MIHPTAVVDPNARIDGTACIGPFCVVGPKVEIDAEVTLVSHVVVAGRTRIGARTRVFPFAALGCPPQDRKYGGEDSTVAVGTDCVIREGVTIHAGTEGGGMETRVGDRCLLMANAHVAHDCRVGNDVMLSNNVMLAGHVSIGDRASLGGGVGVHQHVRIGQMAFVGGLSGLEGDLIPFGLAVGNRARLVGLNLVGLRRAGFARSSVDALGEAVRKLFSGEGLMRERVAHVKKQCGKDAAVKQLTAFLDETSRRSLCRPEPT